MQALILAGGKGTRLRPLTLHTPKPIVPIANRPFLYYQLDLLKPLNSEGAMDVILSLSYQPRKIEEALNPDVLGGMRFVPIVEAQPLGTAGAIKNAQSFVKGTLLVFNGDVLTDIDLRPVLARHRERKAAATLVLVDVEDTRAYGVVELDKDCRIQRFLEKPAPGTTEAKSINAGIYLLEPEVLDLIPPGVEFSFEYELFPRLLESKMPLYGEVTKAYWLDIGTPERYRQANRDVLNGTVRRFPPGSGPKVNDSGSLIEATTTMKSNVEVVRSVVGSNCLLEEGAQVVDSVVLSGTRVGEGARIEGAIIGRGSHIGANTVVRNAVLGDKTGITDFSLIQ